MPAGTTNILVVRHGQSEWNRERRWQGHADSPLSELGVEQAVAAANALRDDCPPFDAVLASDLCRASHTAELLAAALGLGAVRLDARLREAGAGEWQGLTPEEIARLWPGWLEAGRRPPGAEPHEAAAERFLAALRDASAALPGAHVLVVSHSGVVRAARRLVGAPEVKFPNLAGAWFHVGRPVGAGGAEVRGGAVFLPLAPREDSVVE